MELEILVPLIVAVAAWYLNEWSKRQWEAYKRKEESYRKLLMTIKGFYETIDDHILKDEFIDQLNICWLYAPDKVVQKGNDFLEQIRIGNSTDNSKEEGAHLLGEFVLAIREDMMQRPWFVFKKNYITAKGFSITKSCTTKRLV